MNLTAEDINTLHCLAAPLVAECKRLAQKRVEWSHTRTEEERDCAFSNYDPQAMECVVRALAREILEAAEVQTLGGCPLCQS